MELRVSGSPAGPLRALADARREARGALRRVRRRRRRDDRAVERAVRPERLRRMGRCAVRRHDARPHDRDVAGPTTPNGLTRGGTGANSAEGGPGPPSRSYLLLAVAVALTVGVGASVPASVRLAIALAVPGRGRVGLSRLIVALRGLRGLRLGGGVASGAWPLIAPVSPRQKSAYSRPSTSVNRLPRASATNSGNPPGHFAIQCMGSLRAGAAARPRRARVNGDVLVRSALPRGAGAPPGAPSRATDRPHGRPPRPARSLDRDDVADALAHQSRPERGVGETRRRPRTRSSPPSRRPGRPRSRRSSRDRRDRPCRGRRRRLTRSAPAAS